MKHALLAALLASPSLPAAALTPTAPSAPATSRQQAVDQLFARYASRQTPGCAVAVSSAGQTILSRAYGMADLDHAVPATPATIYEAGSVSKQFTAAAILLLARDGKLSLSDDIRRHLPEMPDYGTPVTVGQMIHHTSGLRDWGAVSAMAGWPRNSRVMTNADVLALVAGQKGLNYPPGTHYTYSNTNFNLTAIIVQRVSGQSLAEFTAHRIFKPLGMTATRWRERYQWLVANRATAYAREGAAYIIDQPIEDAYGNGGLLTTTADLLRWNQALDTDALGPGFTAAMQETGVLTGGGPTEYAAGLRVSRHNGRQEIAHSGSTGGYRAWLGRYPAERLSVALLCNASDADPVNSGRAVAAVFLPPSPVRAAAPASPLPQPGLFLSSLTGLPVTITTDAGKLLADGKPLDPLGNGSWQRGDTRYVFSPTGALAIVNAGERVTYQRVPPASAVAIADYPGRYCGVDNDFCLIVSRADGDGLRVIPSSRPGLPPQALTPLFKDGFAAGNGTVLRFVRTPAGTISGLTYHDDRAFGVVFTRQVPPTGAR